MTVTEQDAFMTSIPEAVSDDGMYFYETCVEAAGTCVVRVNGPATVLDYVFPCQDEAAAWIAIHGRARDLADYEALRSARSTHWWAQQHNVVLPTGRAEALAVTGGIVG